MFYVISLLYVAWLVQTNIFHSTPWQSRHHIDTAQMRKISLEMFMTSASWRRKAVIDLASDSDCSSDTDTASETEGL